MKNITTIIAALFLMTFTVNSFAQNNASASADASAKVVSKLTITNDRALNFGTVANNAAGTVTLAAEENPTPVYSNTGMVVNADDENISTAKFTITGEKNYSFSMDIDEEIIIEGNSDEMTINLNPSLSAEQNQINNSGAVTLYVGGTLNVDAEQATGTYEGEFEVTVAYE